MGFFLSRHTMTDATRPELPDHLSIDPRSPHHVAAIFEHDIGIRFNDKERFDVEEYCVSEGWVKVPPARRWTARATSPTAHREAETAKAHRG